MVFFAPFARTIDHWAESGRKQVGQGAFVAVGSNDDNENNDPAATPKEQNQVPEGPSPCDPCPICYGHSPASDSLALSCGCTFCRGCLERAYTVALSNKLMFRPPRCSCETIPYSEAKPLLTAATAKAFDEMMVEHETPPSERVYCYKPGCGKFIPPGNIVDGVAICVCNKKTCGKCKVKAHGKKKCAANQKKKLGRLAKALYRKSRFQRCYKCKHLVEREDGCNHISCVCGAHFCYSCGEPISHPRGRCQPGLNTRGEDVVDESDVDSDEDESVTVVPSLMPTIPGRDTDDADSGTNYCLHDTFQPVPDTATSRCGDCSRSLRILQIRQCTRCLIVRCRACRNRGMARVPMRDGEPLDAATAAVTTALTAVRRQEVQRRRLDAERRDAERRATSAAASAAAARRRRRKRNHIVQGARRVFGGLRAPTVSRSGRANNE